MITFKTTALHGLQISGKYLDRMCLKFVYDFSDHEGAKIFSSNV
jgi:hypothetical protein